MCSNGQIKAKTKESDATDLGDIERKVAMRSRKNAH